MPSFYLDKIDGAGYIEKYNFSFMPGSGPYEYDSQNSKTPLRIHTGSSNNTLVIEDGRVGIRTSTPPSLSSVVVCSPHLIVNLYFLFLLIR